MRIDIVGMSREERRAWLAETKPRHDLAELIRRHIFHASRPWPDGSKPSAPNWNPGCSCGASLYFFEYDDHLAGAILAAGWTPTPPPDATPDPVGETSESEELA